MIPRRSKPDPVPAIHPVWEYQADGALAETYGAYKSAFQVPWVGVVSMAYAHYPSFFAQWWRALEPVVASTDYVETCLALRSHIERAVAALKPPPIEDRLREIGYSDRELGDIRAMIEVFSHGNFAQLPAVVAAHLLLEGGAVSGGVAVEPHTGRHGPEGEVPFVLMEPHHAAGQTQAVYRDVMDRLGLPFVNTDYRALSRWPSYFELAWGDLKWVLKLPGYEAVTARMHEKMFKAAARLPNPTGLSALQLQEAAARDASVAEVIEVTRLFSYLLPGLVTNIAYLRAQFTDRS
ncbi:MAG: hypothetical protein ACR2PM_06920 [Hyphomicrobiales bacterium]